VTGAADTQPMRPHDDLLRAFLAHLRPEVSAKTYRLYRGVLNNAHRDLRNGVVIACEDELREWLWGRELAPKSRNVYTTALRRFHTWLRIRGLSDYNPTEMLPMPRLPRRLPRPVPLDQLHIVLTRTRYPERLWCTIAAYTGARCVEIARLDRSDITERSTRLYGKGSKERTVPTHPTLWAAVRGLPPGPVASIVSADPATSVSHRIAAQCRRVGPDWSPRVTAHRLRHTFATEVLRRTRDLRLVQELLGHESPADTAIYTQVTPEWMDRAVADLPDWTDPESQAADDRA
jgi:site-specific recombinase XerD